MMKICKYCNTAYNPAEICCPKCGSFETLYPADAKKEAVKAAAAPGKKVEKRPEAAAKPEPKPVVHFEPEKKAEKKPVQASPATGRLLKSFSMISMYEGEPTIGISKATGDLLIYDDRVVFKKKLGNALGGAFGLVGLLVAQNQAKKLGDIVLRYDQIKSVSEGRYMGCMPTIVITDRYGLRLSFAGTLNGSSLREAIRAMQTLTT